VFQKDIRKLRASNKKFLVPSSLSKDQWISVSKNPDTIILTFDDGYIDHSQLVAPFLDTMGIKGLFFVPSQTLVARKTLSVNKIHIMLHLYKGQEQYLCEKVSDYLIQEKYYSNVKLSALKYKFLREGKYDEKHTNFLKRVLQRVFTESDLDIFSARFMKSLDLESEDLANKLYLNSTDFDAMVSRGHSIGLHGHQHLYLSSLEKEAQETDILKNIKIFQERGIMTDHLFAYPYGDYNFETLGICSKLDIKVAFTDNMHNVSLTHPHLTLPRIDCNDYFSN
jgi:peptidoglycan/xylan/chitin deacetylase (PgdA/CDA1 family)